ncbi:MAG: ABC transporter ATP-binding protein [Candidatus Verstraetearchaeota archaeon]|jgi:branched-chain amino acid transport system ATP-binding protein|nr:ABC transporter ATP-binding protein [Candidatus Verstraetearchaeota archaeon]
MLPEKSVLCLKDVTKKFGGLVALDKVSFEINYGEIVGLIGPNGAGKTTLINVVCGVLKADDGDIFFEGKKITNKKPHQICRMGIARTYQIPKPFWSMSAVENVAIGMLFGKEGKSSSLNEAKSKAIELLEFVGFPKSRINAKARDLKLLEIKFLEIARALATNPKLLLLDEPFAGLTPPEIDDAVELVRKINELGVTIIIVEHVIPLIVRLAQRLIVLNFGKKIADGNVTSVINDEEVIKAYLGEKIAA